MITLVVTGGIGSGKSAVCSILQEMYGCGIYKADDRVKMLYSEHPSLLSEMEDRLGERFRGDDGVFSPGLLAARIFRDREALEIVESLVFPALEDDFRKWAETHAGDSFVVFESATIMEKPQLKGFGDRMLLIDAPFDVRLSRACMRDGASEDAVLSRMMNQKLMNDISYGKVSPDVDAVICNTGTMDELKVQLTKVIEDILKLK